MRLEAFKLDQHFEDNSISFACFSCSMAYRISESLQCSSGGWPWFRIENKNGRAESFGSAPLDLSEILAVSNRNFRLERTILNQSEPIFVAL